jgi:hypothetical protein
LTSIGYALVRNAAKSDQPSGELSELAEKFSRTAEAEDNQETKLISVEPQHA